MWVQSINTTANWNCSCLLNVCRGYSAEERSLSRNINTDMLRMWTIILQRAEAGWVLLTKGLNTTWLLALEGPGGGPVRWRDNLAASDPYSSPGWGVIYPSVLASDNLPLIKGQSLSDRAELSGEGETGGLPLWDAGILTATQMDFTDAASGTCTPLCACSERTRPGTHFQVGIYTGMCT